MNAKANAPVIIKRKKVVAGGGHHGGAWKVAYADFVTAMMAFFMLMWLLNATTEKQRKGIADYFSPTIPISRISGGGDGSFGGDSVFTEDTLSQNGTGASAARPSDSKAAKGSTGTDVSEQEKGKEAVAFSKIQEALTGNSGESMVANELMRHVNTRVTDEGLIVEIFELADEPLFVAGSQEPTPALRDLTAMIAGVFDLVQNQVAINGFTRSEPITLINNPVWNLSSERADQVRQLLQAAALPANRIQRVSGFADRKPAVSNPMAVRNNRIELILLRQGM